MSTEDVKVASHYLGGTIGDELATIADRLRTRRRTAPQVPRHLPAGRPRRPPCPHPAEAAARLLVHGARLGPRRRDQPRAVAGPRPAWPSSPTRSCASPPARACSSTWSTRPSCATRRRHQRLAAHHARRLRRRRAQRDGLPAARPGAPGDARSRSSPRWSPASGPDRDLLGAVGRRRKAVTAEPSPAAQHPERPSAHARPEAITPIDEVEPIYGEAYLPRKFKIGIAWPGDNCIDVYSNDVGIVPTLTEGTAGELTGFVVLAGGGMGMTHDRPDDTYPLLARPVGWVPPADLGDVVEAIITDAARPRQPRRPQPGPPEVPARRARHRLAARPDRGRAPGARWRRRSRCRNCTTTPTSAGTRSTASTRSACRSRRARSSAAIRTRCAGSSPTARGRAAGHRTPGPAARRRQRSCHGRARPPGQRRHARQRPVADAQPRRSPARRCPPAARRSARPNGCCPTWSTISRRSSTRPATRACRCAST